MELSLLDVHNPGLGSLNRLFMASELVHLNKKNWTGIRLALIEEIEAHLHPQVQLKVIENLREQQETQLLVTTHSPNLASKVDLEKIIICRNNNAYSLSPECTNLDRNNYVFLEKFLDVSKSNLFFGGNRFFVKVLIKKQKVRKGGENVAKSIDLSRTQQHLEWLKTKLYLDSSARNAKDRVVKRGEVYKCNLGQGIGNEECKERPCVIIQNDAGNVASPNVIIAPITHKESKLPIVVPVAIQHDVSGNIILDGNVLLGNIVCVSKARLGDYITKLSLEEMEVVDKAIAISVGIKRHYDKLKNIFDDKLDYIDKLNKKIKILEEERLEHKKIINKLNELQMELGFEDFEDMKNKLS